ncbi:MAG: pantetheine-phosphate adenylyltransferase [Muribaculaceae bacterium]|nr:pantetheine-phosphate adenylyltransferase [Muribaculaceae bacterium]MDE6541152.1 pantetheine-phosphate adenylyltransferase [Muribaculaceae bacterium]
MTKTSPSKPEARVALFAGSFRPFTTGHESIVVRGLDIFDRIVVGVGVNSAKPDDRCHAEDAAEAIRRVFAGEDRVDVMVYDGLTVDAADAVGATALLRGVRSTRDFDYERDLADVNRQLSGIETVLLYSLPELAAVSSSIVRELASYGRDVSAFLPQPRTK